MGYLKSRKLIYMDGVEVTRSVIRMGFKRFFGVSFIILGVYGFVRIEVVGKDICGLRRCGKRFCVLCCEYLRGVYIGFSFNLYIEKWRGEFLFL